MFDGIEDSAGPTSVDALRARASELRRKTVPRWFMVLMTIAILSVVGWGLKTLGGAPHDPPENNLPRVAAMSTSTTLVVQSGNLVVNVVGAVASPGVYRLASDARIDDALRAAGGASPDADLDRVNRAQKLTDGAHIFIVRKGQAMPSPPSGSTSSNEGSSQETVNINVADAKQLESLPGVGPTTAQAIIAYRTSHGPFRSVDDLGKVKGIGPSKLEQIRAQASVS